MREIAAKAGVSVATVSRALNGQPRISEETKARICAVAAQLGYTPSAAVTQALRAVRLRGRASYRYTIACIAVAESLDSYARFNAAPPVRTDSVPVGWQHILMLWRGMTARAAELGVDLDFFSLKDVPPEQIPAILRARNIGAAIFYMRTRSGHEENAFKFLLPRLRNLSCVALGPCDPARVPATIVGVDLFEAGRRSYLEAWRAGYRRIIKMHIPAALDPDHRFDAGIRFAALQGNDELPVQFVSMKEFQQRFSEAGEDCCFVGSLSDGSWVKAVHSLRPGTPVPGFISWHANLPHAVDRCTGIDQRDAEQGRIAVDLAVAGLDPAGSARDISGVECLLHPGWVEGESAPARANLCLNLLPDHPYRAESGKWAPVPLRNHYTASLAPNSLWLDRIIIPRIPAGQWRFHGIPFSGEAADHCSDPGVILMHSTSHPRESRALLPKSLSLPVRRRGRAIYFLHTCGYAPSGRSFAQYRVFYTSGESEAIPLVRCEPVSHELPRPDYSKTQANIGDWFAEYHPLASEAARPVGLLEVERRSGNVAYLYVLEWINPHPKRTIDRIEVSSDGAGPGMLALFAVTLAI